MRSGALAGLALVAVLSLPVLLVLTVKAPHPVADEAPAPARVWAAEPPVRAAPEAAVAPVTTARATPIVTAVAEPVVNRDAPVTVPAAPATESPRGGTRGGRPALSVDLIPVLDDESGTLTMEDPVLPMVPAAKPARPNRVAAPPSKTP